jgi:cytochrome c oxidase subunit 1
MKRFFSIPLVRGLVWFVVGLLAGAAIVTGIRAVMGLELFGTRGFTEPAWVFGGFVYNTLMSLHGMIMIVSILLGIAGIINYVVPLLLGAQDMAFPRLNAFSYWIAVPAAVLLLMSFPRRFDTGWTGYPPLSARAPKSVCRCSSSACLQLVGLPFRFVELIGDRRSYARQRHDRHAMPIFVWAAIATSLIAMTATQLIGLSFQLVMFQRLFGMGFFDPAKGGNPVLFQHLFWFYSHPAVYVFILPGLGVISELLPVFARKPLFGYRWIAMSSLGIALVGFVVWAHHMFTSGMNEYLRVPFMYSTLLVAVPTGVKFFSWVATLWKGKISTPTTHALRVGRYRRLLDGRSFRSSKCHCFHRPCILHDTYFIVGHFHDTIFGGLYSRSLLPSITGSPKHRTPHERNPRQLHFWLMTPSFFVLTSA